MYGWTVATMNPAMGPRYDARLSRGMADGGWREAVAAGVQPACDRKAVDMGLHGREWPRGACSSDECRRLPGGSRRR